MQKDGGYVPYIRAIQGHSASMYFNMKMIRRSGNHTFSPLDLCTIAKICYWKLIFGQEGEQSQWMASMLYLLIESTRSGLQVENGTLQRQSLCFSKRDVQTQLHQCYFNLVATPNENCTLFQNDGDAVIHNDNM